VKGLPTVCGATSKLWSEEKDMRFGKFSLAAIAAATLVCAPVMARSLDSPIYTENIVVAQAPAEAAPVVEATIDVVDVMDLSDDRITADEAFVVTIERVSFKQNEVHLAVLPPSPVGITSFLPDSLVDLSAQSRFENFADRYRAHNTT
jgi:hypothetical protein